MLRKLHRQGHGAAGAATNTRCLLPAECSSTDCQGCLSKHGCNHSLYIGAASRPQLTQLPVCLHVLRRHYPRQLAPQQPQQQQQAAALGKQAARQQSRAGARAHQTTAAATRTMPSQQRQPTGVGPAALGTAAAGRRAGKGVGLTWQSLRRRAGRGARLAPRRMPARASWRCQQQQQARRRW